MLKSYPCVQRWEQTDDVLQNAVVRLIKALEKVVPDSPRHFYNLAAQHLRWELMDLARHYQGPKGLGAKHHTDGESKAADDSDGPLANQWDGKGEPESLEDWTLFHEAVGALPAEEREVFNLLWYEGMTQEEAAAVVSVSLRTIKRRWQEARRLLAKALSGKRPR
jgi:RNA polymerase sigma-70 factor (ECF subfamily)